MLPSLTRNHSLHCLTIYFACHWTFSNLSVQADSGLKMSFFLFGLKISNELLNESDTSGLRYVSSSNNNSDLVV